MTKDQFHNYARRTILFISLSITMAVGACTHLLPINVKTNKNRNCIPPIVKYGYSISATASPNATEQPFIITEGWEPQLSLQQREKINYITSLVYYNGSIWMITHSGFGQVTRFNPDERKLKFYTVRIDEQSEFVPSILFVSSEGELWGLGNNGTGNNMELWPSNNGKFRGIMSRYEPRLDRFLPVMDKGGLLIDSIGNIRIDDDSKGNLWIVLPDKTVARFTPRTLNAEIVLNQTTGYAFSEISVDPYGKIWLSTEFKSASGDGKTGSASELVQYDPELNKLISYGVPPGLTEARLPFPIFIDHQGRIWTAGEWLEKNKDSGYEWYVLVPQPEFVTLNRIFPDQEFSVAKYEVASPDPVLEASDGSMWFNEKGGLLRLEPENGEWCRIADGSINSIIEDDKGNLWIAENNQLYKNGLKP